MSGEKRTIVQIEDNELRRLREQETRLRNVQRDLPERLNAIRRGAINAMNDRIAPLQQRLDRHGKMVNSLSTDLGRLERHTNNRFQQQQRNFENAIQNSEKHQQNYTDAMVSRLGSRMDRRLSDVQLKVKGYTDHQISNLRNDVAQEITNSELRQRGYTNQQIYRLRSDVEQGLNDLELRQKDYTDEHINLMRREFDWKLTDLELETKGYTDQKVQNLRSDMNRCLDDQREEYINLFNQQRGEYMGLFNQQRSEYMQLFESQDRKFVEMINNERQQRIKEIDNLQGHINAIMADSNRKQKYAQALVNDLNKIFEETHSTIPHQRFAPGEIEIIRMQVQNAINSANGAMPESAVSTAQQAYLDLCKLREKVLQKEQEFIILHNAALENARLLLEEVHANRHYNIEKTEEGDAVKLEVDYWTYEELSQFENEVKSIHKRIEDEQETLSIDELRKILEQLEELQPRTAEIVEKACRSIIASQLRAEIADMAIEALETQGYGVQDATYEGKDPRETYVAKMKNIAGSEISLVISPVDEDKGLNEVSIHSYDATFVDENTLMERACQITEMLSEEGVMQASKPREIKGGAKAKYSDIRKIRAKTLPTQRTAKTASKKRI